MLALLRCLQSPLFSSHSALRLCAVDVGAPGRTARPCHATSPQITTLATRARERGVRACHAFVTRCFFCGHFLRLPKFWSSHFFCALPMGCLYPHTTTFTCANKRGDTASVALCLLRSHTSPCACPTPPHSIAATCVRAQKWTSLSVLLRNIRPADRTFRCVTCAPKRGSWSCA
jgi:hypothetical protein